MKKTYIRCAGWLLALLLGLLSCVKDGLEDCDLKVRFRYVYNMKNADAFVEEVSQVRLWVFDAEERLVGSYDDRQEKFSSAYFLSLPHLHRGSYTFVAMARSTDKTGTCSDFEVPDLQAGAPLDSLWARLQRDDRGSNASELNVLLMGVLPVEITGTAQTVGIEMIKCTNTLRVLLLPADADGARELADLEMWIEGKNGWLTYDAGTYREERLIYHPYDQEVLQESRTTVREVVAAEFSTSRLRCDLAPRLVVRNRRSGTDLLNINLTWLLSLQAIGEHRREWSDQEYLDRQDEFALTFIINGNTWLQTKIVVNGWVLSLSDIGL